MLTEGRPPGQRPSLSHAAFRRKNGQRNVSSPGRAEQGVGMETHLSGAACHWVSGFGSQGVSAGRLQSGIWNSDPWANWFKDKLRSFTINSFCCCNSLNAQSVPVPPPSVSSTPGNQGAVLVVLNEVGQVNRGFRSQDLGDLYDDVGLLPGFGGCGVLER